VATQRSHEDRLPDGVPPLWRQPFPIKNPALSRVSFGPVSRSRSSFPAFLIIPLGGHVNLPAQGISETFPGRAWVRVIRPQNLRTPASWGSPSDLTMLT